MPEAKAQRFFIDKEGWDDRDNSGVGIFTLQEILENEGGLHENNDEYVEIKVVGVRRLTIKKELTLV